MKTQQRLLKNAVSNLGRGSAIGIVALILPPVLVRHMTSAAYGVWVLVLQATAYIGYLDFGLQTAIGRYIAFADEKKDADLRDSIFSTAFAGLLLAAILGYILLTGVAVLIPWIFPGVPSALIPMMRKIMLLIGAVTAIGVPASAWNGVFVGLQRNEIPALTVGGAKFVTAAGLIGVVFAGGSLLEMALVVVVTNVASYVAQYGAMRRISPDIRFEINLVRKAAAKELLDYCVALTVMSFSMLLITGFDLILVGRFQFSAVVPYSVAAGLIPFLSGSLFAVMNAMMPHATALHAKNKTLELGDLVISSTRISVLLLIFAGCPLLIYAGPILKIWIGARYVALGKSILIVLIVANMVRLVGAGYAVVLVAAGQQRFIKISPLAEGVSNLAASIVLGLWMGGVGVAFGTLVGAVVSIAAHLFYSMPRTIEAIQFSRARYISSAVGLPILSSMPVVLLSVVAIAGFRVSLLVVVLAFLVSFGGGIALLHRVGSVRILPRFLFGKYV